MPVPKTAAVGPLDDHAVRPARVQLLLRAGSLALLLAAVLGAGIALAPNVAAGLGLADRVQATVVSVTNVPGDPDRAGRACERTAITVTWGEHESGTVGRCALAGGADPRVGGTIAVRVLPGWDRVVVGPRTQDAVLAVVLVALLLATGWGALRHLWMLRALAAVRHGRVIRPALSARKDRIRVVHRGTTAIRLRFSDGRYLPARMLVSTSLEQQSLWTAARIHPLRSTLAGRPAGPYVLRPVDGEVGPMVGLGRAIRVRRRSA